jgi:peptidoglycan/LPS O-acetylase OafA/YrhL
MKYRSEIDGLRALAVLPVIIFHADNKIFSGGFLGVDVFFVISGYLITKIILDEIDKGNFSLFNFYDRRARRILPALYFALLLTSITAFMVMLPTQLKEYGQSLISAVLFSANIFFWLKTDYWAQSSEITPLLHIWSLGIEEQFYFIFPLLLLLVKKTSNLKVYFITGIIVSFVGMIYMRWTGHNSEAFYLLPFRSWELLSGGLIPLIGLNTKKYANSISLVSLIALISTFIFFTDQTSPILLSTIPVIATIFLLSNQQETGLSNRVLSNKIFVYIGTISYSLYLFHQPVFALTRIFLFGELDNLRIIACLLLIFFLANISYYLVEIPFRSISIKFNKLIIYILIPFIIFLVFGFTMHYMNGMRDLKISKMSDRNRGIAFALESSIGARKIFWDKYLNDSQLDFENDTHKIRVLYVGDSLSEDLFVASSLNDNLVNRLQIRRIDLDDECIKDIESYSARINVDPCRLQLDKFIKSKILKDSEVIVIAEAWLSNAKYLKNFLDISEVKDKKIVVYLAPQFNDINSLLIYLERSGIESNSSEFKKFVYLNRHQRNLKANRVLSTIANEYNLKIINGYDFFCNLDECSVINESGSPLIIDQVHLSEEGVMIFSKWYWTQLKNMLTM